MFKTRRYLKPRIEKTEEEFFHILDEATLLVEAIILQQSGTNPERFKTLPIKKTSIDSLNDVLITLKSFIKEKLHFIDDSIDDLREGCLEAIKDDREFAQIIIHSMQLNLISDNSDISLYLAPYIESWDLLTSGVQAIILNHTIRSINKEIQRTQMQKKLSEKF
ncbi:MAG: hypothetical protein JXA54_08790 [Candidatus Heimdallarchaeota archaeon]|nr:hypothetical protein [Candidatus Heimdallarchaeota archaeon]